MCKVDGCGGRPIGRGYCGKHYQKLMKYNDPLGGKTATPSGAPMSFINQSIQSNSDCCCFWPFGKAGRGYGVLHHNGRMTYVHRLVCELVHGPAPTPKHEVAHSCGNGHVGCINHRHLRWSTRSENHADKVLHGTTLRGENSSSAKLTERDVVEIRQRYGSIRTKTLAAEFGVRAETINQIVRRERWSHVA